MYKKVFNKSKESPKNLSDGKKTALFSAFFRKQIRETSNTTVPNSATKVKKR
jgi:hypothetical protein